MAKVQSLELTPRGEKCRKPKQRAETKAPRTQAAQEDTEEARKEASRSHDRARRIEVEADPVLEAISPRNRLRRGQASTLQPRPVSRDINV